MTTTLHRTIAEALGDVVTFQGKKGVWRTTHGTHIFIPSDGGAPTMPRRGPDKKLTRKKLSRKKPPPTPASAAPDKKLTRKKLLRKKPPPTPASAAPAASAPDHADHAKEPSAKELWSSFKGMSREEKKSTIKSMFRGISDSATDFLTSAKEETQQFFLDSGHRKEVLKEAGERLKTSPGRMVRNIFQTMKHDVVEAKHAASAILDMINPSKEASPEQRAALGSFSFKFGLIAAGAALAGSALPVAVMLGLSKGVAIRAAARTVAEHHGEHAAHKAAHRAHHAHAGVEVAEIGHHAAAHAAHAAHTLAHHLTALFQHVVVHGIKHALEGVEMASTVVEGMVSDAVQVAKFYKRLLANIADEMSKVTPEEIAKIADEVAKEAHKTAKKAKHESLRSLVAALRSSLSESGGTKSP